MGPSAMIACKAEVLVVTTQKMERKEKKQRNTLNSTRGPRNA